MLATKEYTLLGKWNVVALELLLFTNDADTAKRLTKGVNGAANIYHIVLDKPLSKQQLDKIAAGTELEEGPVPVEEINFTRR